MYAHNIESPAIEPISLVEAKQHLRISHDADDVYLLACIRASREAIENTLEISLIEQVWQVAGTLSGEGKVELPRGPVIDLEQVKINKKILAKQKYPLQRKRNRYYVLNLDGLDGDLYVRYRTGFSDKADDVPAPLRQALLLTVTHFYENRGEGQASLPLHIKPLLAPFRKYYF